LRLRRVDPITAQARADTDPRIDAGKWHEVPVCLHAGCGRVVHRTVGHPATGEVASAFQVVADHQARTDAVADAELRREPTARQIADVELVARRATEALAESVAHGELDGTGGREPIARVVATRLVRFGVSNGGEDDGGERGTDGNGELHD